MKTVIFTPSETQQIRHMILTDPRSRLGTLHVFERVRQRLERQTGLTMIPESFMVRLYPTDGRVAAHVDLDYILQYIQDPTTCLACGRGNIQSTQPGLHWTPTCRRPPVAASVVTIVVNISSGPGPVVSLGPECPVGRNATGGIVPVVSTRRARCLPVDLLPGEAIQFSPWTMNEDPPSALHGTHMSLYVCASTEGPPRPAVFFPYFPLSHAHSRDNEPENHLRLMNIYDGLVQWNIPSVRIVPSHVSPAIQMAIQGAVRAVHPEHDLQLGVGDTDSYVVCPHATQVAARAALVTSCVAVHHSITFRVPTFAAVRPPGHHARRTHSSGFCWRNNTLVAAVYAASLLPTMDGGGPKRICIFDVDFHHGMGLQTILETRDFKGYCTRNNLFILYFSVYRQGTFDSTVCETTTDVGNIGRPGTQTIRLFSSGRGQSTTDRLNAIQRVLLEVTPDFNLLVVAAGFDHCVGEKMEMRNLFKNIPLWSAQQMVGLGECIRVAAKQTTSEHCVAILEGGYEESTLTSIVPAFLQAIGIPGTRPPAPELSSSSSVHLPELDDTTDSDEDVTQYMQALLV